MLGLNPDKPIRLPSHKTAWRIAGAGFAVYLAVAAYVRFASIGTPMPADPLLSGCFDSDDMTADETDSEATVVAEACFDWDETGDVPSLTRRVTERESGRNLILTFDHRKPRSLMPNAAPERRHLALRTLVLENSFGRIVSDIDLGPRQCRWNKRGYGPRSTGGYWSAEPACRDVMPGMRGSLSIKDDTAKMSITLDGRAYRYEMTRS